MTTSEPTNRDALVSARGVSKAFHGRTILSRVALDVFSGEILAFIGKSGSGKSTFLRSIAGLTIPEAGSIALDGEEVFSEGEHTSAWKEARGKVGMIFQSYTLWPHMDVFDNLALAPSRVLNESRDGIEERARTVLAEVGMEHHLHSRPSQLSGGERQRVAIARALMMRPRLLLCDEITSALDPPVAAEVLGVLTKLTVEEGIACIIVTHDLAFAAKAASRIAFFEDGVIKEEAPPEQAFSRPKTPGLQAFVDSVRF
jgi:polar amino acid transport system ATP-binding protein